MKTYTITNPHTNITYTFAEISQDTKDFLLALETEEFVVSEQTADLIRLALNLKGITDEELQATRNGIVKDLSDMQSEKRSQGDWDAYDSISTKISMIVAVIDHEKNNRGMAC